MNFRSLTRTYNRFSLPKKVATGGVAIAGIGALIGIPVLTLNPMRPPTQINEDAYYKSQVQDQSLPEENIVTNSSVPIDTTTPADIPISSNSAPTATNSTPNLDTTTAAEIPISSNSAQIATNSTPNLDTTTAAEIPISSNSTQTSTNSTKSVIPNLNSDFDSNSFGFDTSDTPSNIGENSPQTSRIGTRSNTQNPYGRSYSKASSRYTPNGSLSANPYNASSSLPKNYSSPGDTGLKTRYSLPIPTSSKSYNLQPSPGNVYSNPNNQANTATGKNSLIQPGTSPTSISGSPVAPSTVNQSFGFNQPTPTTRAGAATINTTTNGGYRY